MEADSELAGSSWRSAFTTITHDSVFAFGKFMFDVSAHFFEAFGGVVGQSKHGRFQQDAAELSKARQNGMKCP